MPTHYFVSYSPHRFMTRGDEDGVWVLTRHSGECDLQDVGNVARRLHGCKRYSDAGAKAEDRMSEATRIQSNKSVLRSRHLYFF